MNFRAWLAENAHAGVKELYHATLKGPDNEVLNSFIRDGIDPERAKGYHQGSGFYLYQNKEQALSHARDLSDAQDTESQLIFRKQERLKGSPIIIVVDEPVTPECFDLDYEAFAHSFSKFMYDNYDFFERNARALNLMIKDKDDRRGRVTASFHPDKAPDSFLDGSFQFLARTDLENPISVSPERGGEVSKFARKLADFSPQMFNKFESEYLHLSPAVKYNCKKKIWPVRIEDIDGKVLWRRSL